MTSFYFSELWQLCLWRIIFSVWKFLRTAIVVTQVLIARPKVPKTYYKSLYIIFSLFSDFYLYNYISVEISQHSKISFVKTRAWVCFWVLGEWHPWRKAAPCLLFSSLSWPVIKSCFFCRYCMWYKPNCINSVIMQISHGRFLLHKAPYWSFNSVKKMTFNWNNPEAVH